MNLVRQGIPALPDPVSRLMLENETLITHSFQWTPVSCSVNSRTKIVEKPEEETHTHNAFGYVDSCHTSIEYGENFWYRRRNLPDE